MANSYINLPQTALADVAYSIRTKEVSFAEQVCTVNNEKTTLSGSIPVRQGLLARGANRDLARGASAKTHDMSAGSVNYECLAQVGKCFVADEDVTDWAAYGEDEMAASGMVARADANTAVDLKFADLLESTTENVEFDVTVDGNGAWDDGGAASTPLDDMLAAKLANPGVTLFIYGEELGGKLATHPDFTAEVSNYVGGALNYEQVSTVIAAKLGLPPENVRMMKDRFYNSAAEGQDEVVAHIFGKGCWMGSQANLHFIDPINAKNNDVLETWRDGDLRGEVVQQTRYIDIKRSGGQNRGVTFTNVMS